MKPAANDPMVSRRQLWLLRLSTMIVVPLLVFGALELALRLAGYGYPTRFFVRTRIEGQDFYTANPKFGFRFFSPALARAPMPLRMPVLKPANTYRIFLLGESAAFGDPDPSYGVGRYLQVLLGDRYPGTHFDVECVAITAINSHTILPIARECARRDGDLWIIYMGNNEVIGPFGAGTVFGPKAPSLGFVRANLAFKTTKIGQLMDATIRELQQDPALKSWGGMKMFMNNRLRYDDPSRQRVFDHLQSNLDDILRCGYESGVPVLLSTMAVNLKDCAPFGSLHRAGLEASRQSVWEKAYQEGVSLESTGLYQQALVPYAEAAEIDPEFADLQFRIGTCHLALTNLAQARRDFELARDYDALAIRADSRINQTIRQAAGHYQGKGVYLVDAAEVFAQNSPTGIPGHELFLEHVHPNFSGNYLLAKVFADQVARRLPSAITATDKGSWASPESCDHRLALTIWDRYRIWEVIRRRIEQAPFSGESDHAALARLHAAELDKIKAREAAESPAQATQMYEQALALSPDDIPLRANYAAFLEAAGDLTQAIQQAKQVSELTPQLSGPDYYLGTLLVRAERIEEAGRCFSRALAIDPDLVPALNDLGLLRENQGRTAEATACFQRALRVDPFSVETHLNFGFLEQINGKLDEALAHFKEAARLQPQGPADYFYQAMTQAALGQQDETIGRLRTLLPYQPDFWQARYLLGVALNIRGDYEGAQAQFRQVIHDRPDYPAAYLYLGITLAKQGKADQALLEFQKTLQLDPGNKLARQQMAALPTARNFPSLQVAPGAPVP